MREIKFRGICEYCNRVNELYKCEECGAAVCWECGHDDGTCMVCDGE